MSPLFVTLWRAEGKISFGIIDQLSQLSGIKYFLILGTAWGDICKNKWPAFDRMVAII